MYGYHDDIVERKVTMASATKPSRRPTVVRMVGSGQRRFKFDTGSLCLDLAATAPTDDGRFVEQLGTTDALEEWLAGPGLPSPAGGVVNEDVERVHALRASVIAAARAVRSGAAVGPSTVRYINDFARQSTPVFLLGPGARGQVHVPEANLSPTLAVLARDAVQLLTRVDLWRLRECERKGCSTLFFDRSPAGRRRWCSMKGCGEMMASAAYRRRQADVG
jgi:predicted RNA-binding Zn ribbon-like protein